MRLIDSDKCPCRKCKIAYCHSNCQAFYDWLDAPTVDAVPVVRCKDCDYYRNGICWNEYITSNCDCDLEKEPNGYCDWGEPRDGE